MIKQIVLESKRPGAKEWGIRNQTYSMAKGEQGAKEVAQKEMEAWTRVEPYTEFRIVKK
jgi:hypothetical protein